MHKPLLLILFCALGCQYSFSQTQQGNHKLQNQIEVLKQDTDLSHASWSVCVLDVKKDSVLQEYNSHLSLIPASTHKIITTATALALLKWDFKYETRLEYDGVLDASGTLKGNLYIKGYGDPTLASKAFKKTSDTLALSDQWAKLLAEKGIKKIEGAIIGDATAFEDEMVPYSWIWGDMGNYYGAGSCGLNFMDNKFALYFKSGANKGDSTSIRKIIPHIPGMKVINQTFTKGYSDNAYIYGSPYSLVRYVKGTIPANKKEYEVEGSQPDPPLLCAQMLDSSLRKLGIPISKKASTLRSFLPAANDLSTLDSTSSTSPLTPLPKERGTAAPRSLLYSQWSHTLDKIVTETNIESNNLFAETLLKTLAWNKTKFGDDATGIEIVSNYWKSKGVDLKGFYMADGSGLSRFNAISTKQMAEILQVITKDSLLFKKFYESLPVAGKSGSLGRLCKGTFAENNLHAKSGYMTRVRSYAGYVTTRKGNLLSFAIIVNNYDCTPAQMKDKLEKLMIAIAEME